MNVLIGYTGFIGSSLNQEKYLSVLDKNTLPLEYTYLESGLRVILWLFFSTGSIDFKGK